MIADHTCPEIDKLEALARGALDAEPRRRLQDHLAVCPRCADRLTDVSGNLAAVAAVRSILEDDHPARIRVASREQIGPYRILRELGRGGMGVVYEAEQDRPRRAVALKVIRSGVVSARARRRFDQESQILGRLHHPGIAQIYEAGTADAGDGPQPYFAMELVRGVHLRDYVEGRSLDGGVVGGAHPSRPLGFRERLALMARICDAVQHAHERGVIHRDLKPGNVLVDEVGQPKILDFGVARVTDADVQATTMQTDAAQLIGTIPYMSPEQVQGDPRGIDARSDVYALGVMTYELLAGRLPYDLSGRMIPDALRVIREEDHTPLSTISRAFRGDINTIVARALEKDRERRYPSAADLAADIRRFLHDEPITARPPTALYQIRKFARRHRALVGSVATIMIVLSAATAVSTRQALRARQAQLRAETNERLARTEAEKSDAVIDFLHEMLGAADPEQTPDRPDVTMREVLDQAAARLAEGALAGQLQIEVVVRATIGNTYRSLGRNADAEPHLQEAVAIARRLYPDGHKDLAYAMNKLARVLATAGRLDEAEELFRETLAMQRRLLGEEHEEVAKLMNNLADVLRVRGRYEQAEALHREALAMRRRLLGEEHTSIASSLNNLAITLQSLSRFDEAEALFRESLAMDRALRGDLHPNVASTMSNLAVLLIEQGRHDEAEALLREALALRHRIHGDEHPAIALALNNLALVVRRKGDLQEAERLYRESLDMDRRLHGDRHSSIATTLANLAQLLASRGDLGAAEAMHREALAIRREVLGERHPDALMSRFLLAEALTRQQRNDEALPLLAEAANGARDALPPGHRYTGLYLSAYGRCLLTLNRLDEAAVPLSEAHEIFAAALGPRHPLTTEIIVAMARLCETRGQTDEARRWKALLEPSP
jgi:serine/threonine protein kinase/Flp pilus assembly protein TadD